VARKFLVMLVACCALLASSGVAVAAACERQSSSVYVVLSSAKYPLTTDHILDAQAAGQPALLHIDRENEALHRSQSLAGWPTRPGFDRDEYPPAMSREGGTGADIRYVPPADNRGAGSVMGNALSAYCEDQPFRFRITG
jgi:hypothetical protein